MKQISYEAPMRITIFLFHGLGKSLEAMVYFMSNRKFSSYTVTVEVFNIMRISSNRVVVKRELTVLFNGKNRD